MNPWKLILATVVIFGAGVVLGVMVDYVTHAHGKMARRPETAAATATNRPPAAPRPLVDLLNGHQPEILSQQFVAKLDGVLQLDPAQRDAIHKIIADGQDQNHCIWTNCAAQSRQVLQEVKQRIREQLNPDQTKQFEKLLKQMRPAPHRPPGTNSVPGLKTTNSPAGLAAILAATK